MYVIDYSVSHEFLKLYLNFEVKIVNTIRCDTRYMYRT